MKPAMARALGPASDLSGERSAPSTAGASRKSQRTRTRIFEAAQALFVEIGYHAATNARIAEAAGMTRGAMLYHFDSREALMAAVVPFIQARRAALLKEAAANLPHGPDRGDRVIEAYWKLLGEPAFVAFTELEAAARTDPGLREILRPAEEAFDQAQMVENMFELVQGARGARFQASRDLARFMLEGLARARLTYDAEARTENLLTVVKRAARNLNRKGPDQSLWPE
jgi:AcrR family transcriptional regulator